MAFIITQVFLLTHILALVVYVQQLNPDSHYPQWTEIHNQRESTSSSLLLTTSDDSTYRRIGRTLHVERRQDKTITVWQTTTTTVFLPTTLETTVTWTNCIFLSSNSRCLYYCLYDLYQYSDIHMEMSFVRRNNYSNKDGDDIFDRDRAQQHPWNYHDNTDPPGRIISNTSNNDTQPTCNGYVTH